MGRRYKLNNQPLSEAERRDLINSLRLGELSPEERREISDMLSGLDINGGNQRQYETLSRNIEDKMHIHRNMTDFSDASHIPNRGKCGCSNRDFDPRDEYFQNPRGFGYAGAEYGRFEDDIYNYGPPRPEEAYNPRYPEAESLLSRLERLERHERAGCPPYPGFGCPAAMGRGYARPGRGYGPSGGAAACPGLWPEPEDMEYGGDNAAGESSASLRSGERAGKSFGAENVLASGPFFTNERGTLSVFLLNETDVSRQVRVRLFDLSTTPKTLLRVKGAALARTADLAADGTALITFGGDIDPETPLQMEIDGGGVMAAVRLSRMENAPVTLLTQSDFK